jgi:uncharacterized protein (DUF983 family)
MGTCMATRPSRCVETAAPERGEFEVYVNVQSNPEELSPKRFLRFVGRALMLRCPHCGRGTMFSSWLRMRDACAICRLRFDRGEEDNFIGGYLVNFIVAELIVVIGGLMVVLATWPNVPWDAIMYGLAALMVPVPFLTYPYSKALWLAIDLHFQPVTPSDFQTDPAAE